MQKQKQCCCKVLLALLYQSSSYFSADFRMWSANNSCHCPMRSRDHKIETWGNEDWHKNGMARRFYVWNVVLHWIWSRLSNVISNRSVIMLFVAHLKCRRCIVSWILRLFDVFHEYKNMWHSEDPEIVSNMLNRQKVYIPFWV